MFIVQLEHAILYPESTNTKTSTENCTRWDQNHLYCAAMRTRHTPLLLCTMFKQGERVFLLSVSRCGISRRQAHVTRGDTMGSRHLEL